MARIKGEHGFLNGMIGNVSFYKRKDLEGIIVRTKGGPKKSTIKRSARFANTRKRNTEFGICSKMGAQIRHMLPCSIDLSDYNSAAALNSLATVMLKNDTGNELGKRSVSLSKNRDLLTGFSFNKQSLFESYYSGVYNVSVNKELFSATVNFLPIVAMVHLAGCLSYTHYRFVLEVGGVGDFEFNHNTQRYEKSNENKYPFWAFSSTPWQRTDENNSGITLHIEKELEGAFFENESVIVALGIQFGTGTNPNEVVALKNSGAAKVVAVV